MGAIPCTAILQIAISPLSLYPPAMFSQLDPSEYEIVRPLIVPPHPYHLIIPAVLDGNSPGRVLTNDPHQPTAVFMTSPEGNFLAGNPHDHAFNTALAAWLQETFFAPGRGELVVCFHPAEWESSLAAMVPDRPILKQLRRHYQCRQLTLDWRTTLPVGYTIHRLDEALLTQSGLTIPDHIPSWLQNNWGNVEKGHQNGFGFVAIHQDQTLVSWCLSDCISGNRTEVGIHTLPDHRRLGIAAATVAAAVEYALNERDYHDVGWHCAEDNTGSWKTAERVGFTLIGRYHDHYCLINQADHLAHTGWRYFIDGRYADTLACYQKLFSLTDDSPPNYYHFAARAAAAVGDHDQAIAYLHQALDRGWNDATRTTSTPEFTSLHDTDAWATLLTRFPANPDP
jgi:RimJ/RimL family protein N-acetyltransferase